MTTRDSDRTSKIGVDFPTQRGGGHDRLPRPWVVAGAAAALCISVLALREAGPDIEPTEAQWAASQQAEQEAQGSADYEKSIRDGLRKRFGDTVRLAEDILEIVSANLQNYPGARYGTNIQPEEAAALTTTDADGHEIPLFNIPKGVTAVDLVVTEDGVSAAVMRKEHRVVATEITARTDGVPLGVRYDVASDNSGPNSYTVTTVTANGALTLTPDKTSDLVDLADASDFATSTLFNIAQRFGVDPSGYSNGQNLIVPVG